jgi:hypothetical protein
VVEQDGGVGLLMDPQQAHALVQGLVEALERAESLENLTG